MTIFISYRRADSEDVVGRIYDHLIGHFSIEHVFRDLDSLAVGKPFPQALDDAVAKAKVALVVIGPAWVSITDGHSQRRLDDPSDFVRQEVEKALAAGFPVIPVLVSRANMPRQFELPESLRPLVLNNGISIRPDPDFHNDINRLIGKLSAFLDVEMSREANPEEYAKDASSPLNSADAVKGFLQKLYSLKQSLVRFITEGMPYDFNDRMNDFANYFQMYEPLLPQGGWRNELAESFNDIVRIQSNLRIDGAIPKHVQALRIATNDLLRRINSSIIELGAT